MLTYEAKYIGDKVKTLRKIGQEMFPKLIKEVGEVCRIAERAIVRDLSLRVVAGAEDEAFAFNPDLWINFRRGNTLVELYDPSDFNKL